MEQFIKIIGDYKILKMKQEKDEISIVKVFLQIKEWYAYIIPKWKRIFLIGLLGSVLGLTYSLIRKPVYIAELTYALEDGKTTTGLGSLASSFGFDMGGAGNTGAFSGINLMELFMSRSMVEKALLNPVEFEGKKMSLAELFIQEHKWRESWEDEKDLININFLPNSDRNLYTRAQDSILGEIYLNLRKKDFLVIQKDEKVAIGTVITQSTNECFAHNFTLSLEKTVSSYYLESKSKKARENLKILEFQTDSVRNELNTSLTNVAIANDNTFGLNPAFNIKRVQSTKKQVDVQANSAILAELVKQTELAKVTLRKETPLIQVIDKPILPLQVDKVSKLKSILLGFILFSFFYIIRIIVKKIVSKLDVEG